MLRVWLLEYLLVSIYFVGVTMENINPDVKNSNIDQQKAKIICNQMFLPKYSQKWPCLQTGEGESLAHCTMCNC